MTTETEKLRQMRDELKGIENNNHQMREELKGFKNNAHEMKEELEKMSTELQVVKADFISHAERVQRVAESLRVRGEVIAKLERSYAELGVKWVK